MGASLLPLVLAVGCSSRNDDRPPAQAQAPATIVVDDQTIEIAALTEAIAGLCQARQEAATDAGAARTTYDRRSRYGIDVTARALQHSNALLASSMVTTVARVQAGPATGPAGASLGSDLGRLTELMREGLARLGVPTAACER